MSQVQSPALAKADVWRAYRAAFEDFSQRVKQVQSLIAKSNPNRAAIDAALLELEKARVVYNGFRDAVAVQLLRKSTPQTFLTLERDSPEAYAGRVRGIAELLWEGAGRPDGTADDDWRRAEEILRRAAAA